MCLLVGEQARWIELLVGCAGMLRAVFGVGKVGDRVRVTREFADGEERSGGQCGALLEVAKSDPASSVVYGAKRIRMLQRPLRQAAGCTFAGSEACSDRQWAAQANNQPRIAQANKNDEKCTLSCT